MADDGLNNWSNVGEGGDREEVDEVIPVLLAPQGAEIEAITPD